MTKRADAGPQMRSPSGSDAPASAAAVPVFRSPVGCTGDNTGEQEFLCWCKQERVRFPSSHLAQLAATGRALVASRPIMMGEVVVEVPDGAVLMAENCSIHDVLEEEGMCKPADNEILEVQGLIIAVMYEKWLGDKSNWAPYLALLPDNMTHMPLYWKRREFEELRGTAAYDKMMGRVQHPADAPTQVPLLWCEVVEPFISEHPELGLPGGQQGYELYRWATCAVASYSFLLGDDKYQAMVPVWDLLNHITGAVNVRLHHWPKRQLLQMIATRDIRAGEELVNNYGELSNAELLRGYGFVEQSNKNNHAQVPLSFVARAARQVLELGQPSSSNGKAGDQRSADRGRTDTAAAAGPGPGSANGDEGALTGALKQTLAARLRLGRRLGLLPQDHVFKIFKDRPPPGSMTALAYLLTASDGEAATVREAGRRAAAAQPAGPQGARQRKGGKQLQQQQHGQSVAAAAVDAVAAALERDAAAEARTVQVYEHVVRHMLERYCCSMKEDRRLLQQYGTLPVRLKAALLARMPEKEALEALGQEVRRRGAMRRSLSLGPTLMPAKHWAGSLAGVEPIVDGHDRGGKEGISVQGDQADIQSGCHQWTESDAGFAFGFTV